MSTRAVEQTGSRTEQTAGQNKGPMSSSSSSDEYYCTYEEYLNDLHEDKMYDLEAEQELERLEYERALVDEQEWHDWIEEKQAIEDMELAYRVNPYRMGRIEDLIHEYGDDSEDGDSEVDDSEDGDSEDGDSDDGYSEDGDYCNCITCCYNDVTDEDIEYVTEFIINNYVDIAEREYHMNSSINHHELFDEDEDIPYYHFLVRTLVYGSSLVTQRIKEQIKRFIAENWHSHDYIDFDYLCTKICEDFILRSVNCVRDAIHTSQNFGDVIDQFEEETHWGHMMREVVCHPLAVKSLCREWAEEEDHLLVG